MTLEKRSTVGDGVRIGFGIFVVLPIILFLLGIGLFMFLAILGAMM